MLAVPFHPPDQSLLKRDTLLGLPRVPLRHFQRGRISFQIAHRLPARNIIEQRSGRPSASMEVL
jgi:hypothetical protein